MTAGQARPPWHAPNWATGAPWTIEGGAVADALSTDPARGLSQAEVVARLEIAGPNELLERARVPAWRLLAGQFTNTMIVVLVIAAAVTAVIGDMKDSFVILAIVALNGAIGFVQEYRADRAMAALRALTSPTATVVRDARAETIPARDLVPGDLIHLEAGDIVPADARLLEAAVLAINEAAMTGESEPAQKVADALPEVADSLIADQRNMAFKGTSVTSGRGSGIVVATGMATALGRIAELLQGRGAGPTPLQVRLAALGRALAAAAFVVCVIVFALGLARGERVELMFLTAVSLAVAAIPEALPAVVTVSLALGAQRMVRRRALIRKLPAVETLGSVTVVCSDKTGTLTENRMLVERVWTPGREYLVSGQGYEPVGAIAPAPEAGSDPELRRLAEVAAACNDAVLRPPAQPGHAWTVTGDPTEGALLALAAKAGVEPTDLAGQRPRIGEVPFDAGRRRMCTVHARDGGVWMAIKGAFEALRPADPELADGTWDEAGQVAERYAADGYRVLALAERRMDATPADLEDATRSPRLVGLVAIADAVRSESPAAVAAARQAGITPVLVTGDHQLTAEVVARRVGILGPGRTSMTGTELERLDDDAFDRVVADVAVYARTNPEQKLRIVEAWKRRGAIVAMTGDGVNDAPALKRADIGVAMGITGTQVSQEAADMVLADDNFATIVAAVEEGRRIYDNIRRFVRYTLTSNSGEIWAMVLAPLAGLPLPLLPVHILWVNLVTDGLPGLALGVEPAESDTMRRSPRPQTETILGRGLWQSALWVGLLMGAVTLGVQAAALASGWHWQTMAFSALVLLQLGNALAVRSERQSFFQLGWRTNVALSAAVAATLLIQLAIVYVSPLQPIFATQSLSPMELGVVLAASTLVFAAIEVEKWAGRRAASRRS
jgi:Ca2+-transporting ATPase